MIYFTADLHFYHDKIITHVNRSFHDAQQMNQALILNWNQRVSPEDEVYILGDVTMKGSVLAMEALSQLKGRKYLIRGNHDGFVDRPSFDQSLFSWVKDYAELVYCNTRFVLFHYPMLEWNGYFDQSIHLHGHQHNYVDYNYHNLQQGIRRYDVGVDANRMSPVSVEEILSFFSKDSII